MTPARRYALSKERPDTLWRRRPAMFITARDENHVDCSENRVKGYGYRSQWRNALETELYDRSSTKETAIHIFRANGARCCADFLKDRRRHRTRRMRSSYE